MTLNLSKMPYKTSIRNATMPSLQCVRSAFQTAAYLHQMVQSCCKLATALHRVVQSCFKSAADLHQVVQANSNFEGLHQICGNQLYD
ncbi:MAG: hypothetical protein LBU91_08655 [Bacteroidales bacterium]|nr:hypothetical protein [Bacteroidales bacterium]